MTEKEAKVYKSLIKQMRFRHPFSWKKYKNHVTIVAYLMDKIEEWDDLKKKRIQRRNHKELARG